MVLRWPRNFCTFLGSFICFSLHWRVWTLHSCKINSNHMLHNIAFGTTYLSTWPNKVFVRLFYFMQYRVLFHVLAKYTVIIWCIISYLVPDRYYCFYNLQLLWKYDDIFEIEKEKKEKFSQKNRYCISHNWIFRDALSVSNTYLM